MLCGIRKPFDFSCLQVATEVTTWHPLMVVAELGSLLLYAVSMVFLPQYFGMSSHVASFASIADFCFPTQTLTLSCRWPSYGRLALY